MDISFKDAKILWSGIWYKEVLVNKKRRWLMQMSSQEASEVRPKKLRKPKSLSNKFLNESFVRKDEASTHALKINVEKSYTSLCRTDERLLEVENYMLLSDVHTLQKGLDADVEATDHLTGQASSSKSFQDQEDMLDASKDNVGIEVLMQSMKDVLPSMTDRCSERVKKLMKKP